MSDQSAAFLADSEFLDVAATYTPSREEGRSIQIEVQERRAGIEDQEDGRVRIEQATITLAHNDDDGVAAPALGDEVTFDSLDWVVTEIGERGLGLIDLAVKRTEVIEKSPGPHRIRRY